jgi:hypothetical protein
MIATVPSWPNRPLFRRNRRRQHTRMGTDLLGRALEVIGLVIFVAVIGTVPAIVAVFSG